MADTIKVDIPGNGWHPAVVGPGSGYMTSNTGFKLLFKIDSNAPEYGSTEGHTLEGRGKENYSLLAGEVLYIRQSQELHSSSIAEVIVTPD